MATTTGRGASVGCALPPAAPDSLLVSDMATSPWASPMPDVYGCQIRRLAVPEGRGPGSFAPGEAAAAATAAPLSWAHDRKHRTGAPLPCGTPLADQASMRSTTTLTLLIALTLGMGCQSSRPTAPPPGSLSSERQPIASAAA